MKINQEVKLKKGGRKAPVIGIDEFREILDGIGRKIPEDEYEKEDIEEAIKENDYYWLFYSNHPCLSKLQKDVKKVEVDFENVNQQGEPKLTKHGIPYLTFEVEGDWEYPLCVFAYWDGKHVRAYIPEKGNTYRRDLKEAFGNNNDDHEYLKNEFGVLGIDNLEIDYPSCLEDFESRLEVG